MAIKQFCDKCDKEVRYDNQEMDLGFRLEVRIDNNYTAKKTYCRECLYELLPGCVALDDRPTNYADAARSLGERFEEILREICQEEIAN
jgi:hypothetical protein